MLKPILTEEQLKQVNLWLSSCTRFVLCAHLSPDGDAIGSSLGLASFLRNLGKEVTIVMPNQFPEFLQWMSGTDKILLADRDTEQVKSAFAEAEVVCCLDFNDLSRIEELGEIAKDSSADFWLIDHHLNPGDFCKVSVSFPEMSSTCELVFRIIYQLGGFETMTKEAAECIYCGMCTDTGGFTYNSNSSDIFFIISLLLEKGIDKDLIYRKIYNNYSANRVHLMGYVLYEKLQVLEDVHASYFTLDREELERFHFIKGDAEGLVNIPLTIKGMKLSISLREDTEKDRILVSLRSVDDFPCNKMSEEFFNGGGHKNAAGGRLECSMEEAVELVKKAIHAYEPLLLEKNSY